MGAVITSASELQNLELIETLTPTSGASVTSTATIAAGVYKAFQIIYDVAATGAANFGVQFNSNAATYVTTGITNATAAPTLDTNAAITNMAFCGNLDATHALQGFMMVHPIERLTGMHAFTNHAGINNMASTNFGCWGAWLNGGTGEVTSFKFVLSANAFAASGTNIKIYGIRA